MSTITEQYIFKNTKQSIGCTTQTVSPEVNYELQFIILHQYWLIIPDGPMQEVNSRDVVCEGLYRNSLYFPLNFSVNLKWPLKKTKASTKV